MKKLTALYIAIVMIILLVAVGCSAPTPAPAPRTNAQDHQSNASAGGKRHNWSKWFVPSNDLRRFGKAFGYHSYW